ncbi:MAG: beta-ketoacyl synthase N-terminal-like domain-containing protein [Potamolinea sp.]
MNKFTCLSLSPIELAHPGLAIAASRSGGVGVLDREFCSQGNLHKAIRNLEKLLNSVKLNESVGLRLRLDQIAESQELLAMLDGRAHWLILCSWNGKALASIASLPNHKERQLLLEVTNIEEIGEETSLTSFPYPIAGLIAKGHESGGWVGEDSAFVLTQKLVQRQPLPVYVQGGIGIHTAAACRAAGSAGVVLDDQLWLMAESPLKSEWQQYLHNLNGQEATVIGERISANCRVLSRPGFSCIPALQKLALQLEVENAADLTIVWQQQAQPLLGWGDPGILAWPMGQTVGLAAGYAKRFRTTGRFIQALLQTSQAQIQLAQTLQPLNADTPLAVSHKTKYPIVQGPMTRVSDTAEFANAVSQAGGLPLLALALMRCGAVRELLQKTQALLGTQSWGIGILGFVPQAVREEQLREVLKVKPPFALIAGGRPDQAAKLEAEGIATYIHVPVPALLKMFLEQGAKRFVLEGRECGGHVGPLSSFLLWESAISTLLEYVPTPPNPPLTKGETLTGTESDIHILFAGGIHDALSAAMVSAMAVPLAERGIKIGVLMGSAYLFTEEAVACGAIVKEYQDQALRCTRTINLETGVGHANRCVVTPFAEEFNAIRRQMLKSGSSPEEIKNALEDLTLGRLRIASKGLVRQGSEIIPVQQEQQVRDGMYMIGQVATLRDRVCTVQQLHQDVAENSSQLLLQQATENDQPSTINQPSDIAIIGISTLLPQAEYAETFWENILRKVDSITEIPQSRWDWRLYYDPDKKARDKIYSKWGGFIDDVPFDPMRFGIPPKSLKSIEPLQLLALEAVRRALEDAKLAGGDFDREHTSVILGAGGGIADLGQQYATRSILPLVVESPSEEVWERLPEWTEESFPGLLPNVIAGRVANRFDLGGSNFTVDAACASSLTAIDLAVKELETGRSNLVIAGGVDTVQSPFAYMCFSKTQALSPTGRCRTFDKNADGIAISEGIAIVVLKRLADAQRDGDRIYGIIKSVAGSSDGKALGMTAPLPAGQMRALKRAYSKAGFSPNTLGLYEAHGTGTVAGDRAELETILSTLQTEKAESKSCLVGSVKSMIGHTKSTAGVAGLIKVALSLYNKTLPPHYGVETPLEAIADPESAVYLLKEAHPWLENPNYPRRAGVSAFGFGGTNFHAVLEEYQGNVADTAPGNQSWPCELFVLRAENGESLSKKLQYLSQALQGGASPRLRDLAYTYARLAQEEQGQTVCVSIVAESLGQLKEALDLVLAHLNTQINAPLPLHIQLNLSINKQTGVRKKDKIAFLFPGQGSQYPDMAREVTLYFQEMRSAVELANQQLKARFPKLLSQFIYPPSAYSEAEETNNQQQLTDTHIAQPAIGAVEAGYLDILARLGMEADMLGGHSYGEYTALHAAGVLSREAFLKLSETRGRAMYTACAAADGAMAAVQVTREELLSRLQGFGGVVIANHNAPLQSVISGEKKAVRQVVDSLNVAQIMARMLPVAGAFHSSLVESAQVLLAGAIASAPMESPKIPVYANNTARPYDSDIDCIRTQLSQHLLSPVEFVGQINTMHEDGARIFVEVGPKSILSKLIGQILDGKDHTVVSLDGNGGGLRGLLLALGTLAVRGVSIKLTALFEGRDVQQLDLSKLLELTQKPKLSPTTWLVNGGSVRPQSEAIGYTGKLPPLTLEAREESIKSKVGSMKDEVVTTTNLHTSEVPLILNSPTQSTTPLAMSTSSSEQSASQSIVQPASPHHPIPVTTDAALVAYQAYQQTMRQFLTLQERVMQQFLSAGQMGYVPQSTTPTTPTPIIPASGPTLVNGQHKSDSGIVITHASQDKDVSSEHFYQSTNGRHNGNGTVKPPSVETRSKALQDVSTPVVANVIPSPVVSSQGQIPNRDQLTQILLGLVSDRTGYPSEMLGLDRDMEAELGIDSIKRVEILGTLGKNLPEPYSSSVKEQMESLTRVKSLNGIVEKLLSQNLTAISNKEPQTTVPNRDQLTQILLGLVSDRTGYPTEMLGLDRDMEAELGIDSIKRVEILGALGKNLPEPYSTSVKEQMESLTRVKSLNGIVEKLLSIPSTTQSSQEKNGLGKLSTGVSPYRAT